MLALVRSVPPHFSIPPESVEVLPGGAANLTCVAVGSPMPVVRWRLGTVEIDDSHVIICLFSLREIGKRQGQFYVGAGGTCRPSRFTYPPPQIQELADHSDVISVVQKCSKVQIFRCSYPDHTGRAYSAPSDPLADGEGARCPLSRTPPPLSGLRASFL